MRCDKCPLAFWEESDWETGETDLVCAVDMGCSAYIGESCRRTNKWILSQNREQIIDKYVKEEAACFEKYWEKQQEELMTQYEQDIIENAKKEIHIILKESGNEQSSND